MAKLGDCRACEYERANGITIDTSLSKAEWGRRTNLSKTGIGRHLGHAPQTDNEPPEPGSPAVGDSYSKVDGKITITKIAERIIPLSEWFDDLRADGFDPALFSTSHSHSVWSQHTKNQITKTLYANKFSATEKTGKSKAEAYSPIIFDSVLEQIRTFDFIPERVSYAPETAVIVPADLQVGKVDWHGGSKETAAQALHSFHEFAKFVKESRPQEVVIIDAGDSIENIFNTSSQLGTNDLDLPHQIATAQHIFLEGIKAVAPLAPKIRFASVPSNHGALRLGPKSPGGNAHADFGIVIAEMLRDALTLNERAFGHVTVQTPDPYMESLYFQSSGSDIGVVHGHQSGSPDKIGTWWSGQSHGNMPVSKARILIAGHWHSLRVYQSGDGRWVIVGPSSDRGSTWFTNIKGESSESGMLSFTTRDNNWSNLRIL